jgi:SAM-dependent methyltransferase
MNFKKFYSKYYNLVYENKNYKSEVNYIIKILGSRIKKIKYILELGSGTGAHAYFLLKRGFNLTCVEQSRDMIQNFKVKSKSVKIINKDLKTIKLKKNFDLVLSMFHVINYMIKNKDLVSFFKVASSHLNSGGFLLFDTWYYPAVKYNRPKITKKIFKDKNFKIYRKATPKKLDKKIYKIKYDINILNLNNSKKSNFTEVHRIRPFDIAELDKVSKKFNFKKINNYAFLKKTTPNKNNWGAVLIYQKI